MDPTFFGNSEQPLYGVYHPPIKQIPNESAILICYPTFQEYTRSHRVLKQLADKLSESGNHVFRFDYLATGDSAGELKDININDWKDNTKIAIQELRELSGINKISIVAVRFSAILAIQNIDDNVKDIILWDPIINGQQFIDDLTKLHEKILIDDDRFSEKRNSIPHDGFTELLGYMIPNSLISSIKHESLEIKSVKILANTKILYSSNKNNHEHFGGNDIDIHIVDEDCEWDNFHRIEDALVSPKMTNSIVGLFN